jgi:hypothetical protein
MTPDDADFHIYDMVPSYKYKGDFRDFKDGGGLDLNTRIKEREELRGRKISDFIWDGVVRQRRAAKEPDEGWAQYAKCLPLGHWKGTNKKDFVLFWRSSMCQEWGDSSVTVRIRAKMLKQKQAPLERPLRNYNARRGKRHKDEEDAEGPGEDITRLRGRDKSKGKGRNRSRPTRRAKQTVEEGSDTDLSSGEEEVDLETDKFVGTHEDDRDKLPKDDMQKIENLAEQIRAAQKQIDTLRKQATANQESGIERQRRQGK